jgi:flavin reductase (DIM6/NTAB) family NADH-FMN oxidoreductase RutF
MRKQVGNFDLFKETVDKLDGDGALLMASNFLNPMTIGWGTLGIIWGKPVILILVRSSRYTWGLMEKSEFFSVSFFSDEYSRELEYCGTKSGRKVNKLEDCKFHAADGVNSPALFIEESEFHYECRIIHKTPVDPANLSPEVLDKYYGAGDDYHTVYYGEILGTYVKEG